MSTLNPYEILGIPKNCKNIVEVRRAFNSKAQAMHPDKSAGNIKDFLRLKKSYDYIISKLTLESQEMVANSKTNEERYGEYAKFVKSTPKVGKSNIEEPWKNEIGLDNSVIYIEETVPLVPRKLAGEMGLWKEPLAYNEDSCEAEVFFTGDVLFGKDKARVLDFDQMIDVEEAEYKRNSSGNKDMDARKFLQQETVGYLETEPSLEREDIPVSYSSSFKVSSERMYVNRLEENADDKEKAKHILTQNMNNFSVEVQNMLSGRLGINF